MQSMVLSRESISPEYAIIVILVRPLCAPSSIVIHSVRYRYPPIKLCLQLSSAPRVRRELYSTLTTRVRVSYLSGSLCLQAPISRSQSLKLSRRPQLYTFQWESNPNTAENPHSLISIGYIPQLIHLGVVNRSQIPQGGSGGKYKPLRASASVASSTLRSTFHHQQ